MDISITPMTRELMHEMYKDFQFDPDIFDDMELYENKKNYIYDEKKVDFLFDMRSSEENSHAFAVMLGGEIIGEVGLRHAGPETGECELSVHLKNDQVKNLGYGTEAERLAVKYAFDELHMDRIFAESLIKNTRSQHVLMKVGFSYTGEEDGFKQYLLKKEDWEKMSGYSASDR